MEFLPRSIGTRPRLACELRAEGVVAARAEDASGRLTAVARATASTTEDTPPGRAAAVAALRKALDAVALRARDVTLIVPDAATRVLLLDFDTLPGNLAEALPVVRFRLKKLLPFDAEDAAISYQVMATKKDSIHVLAVAMPRATLAEYESMVREAGFEPGAVLPSTLAALAGLIESEGPTLIVNAGREGVTTAIVRQGELLLHRTVDLAPNTHTPPDALAAPAAPAAEPAPPHSGDFAAITAAMHRGQAAAGEVAQAVSVAAAYFEDTLERTPEVLLSTGTLGSAALTELLREAGVGPVQVREMVDRAMLDVGAASGSAAGVPLGWLAGVRGALSN
jgi:type IV pilus assembly protein PilM